MLPVNDYTNSELDNVQICLTQLRNLTKEAEIIIPTDETEFLLKFVRARKCDTERAFKMVNSYLGLRKKSKKYFLNVTPSVIQPTFNLGMFLVLKHRDSLGRKVFLFRTGLWNPEQTSVDDIMTATLLLLEEMVYSEETQKNGVLFVADQTGLSFKHFRQFSIKQIITILSVLQGNFPLLCKGLHSVNEPEWLQRIASIALPFFSKKLQKRTRFHSKNLESLHEFLSPQILPQSLGGELSWEEANDQELFNTLYSREEHYKLWNSS